MSRLIPNVIQKLEFQQSWRHVLESGGKPALTERLCIHRCEGGGFKDGNAGEDENQFLNHVRYIAYGNCRYFISNV